MVASLLVEVGAVLSPESRSGPAPRAAQVTRAALSAPLMARSWQSRTEIPLCLGLAHRTPKFDADGMGSSTSGYRGSIHLRLNGADSNRHLCTLRSEACSATLCTSMMRSLTIDAGIRGLRP